MLQRLIVCLEESIYIHNIKDMKLLKTLLNTPSNPSGETWDVSPPTVHSVCTDAPPLLLMLGEKPGERLTSFRLFKDKQKVLMSFLFQNSFITSLVILHVPQIPVLVEGVVDFYACFVPCLLTSSRSLCSVYQSFQLLPGISWKCHHRRDYRVRCQQLGKSGVITERLGVVSHNVSVLVSVEKKKKCIYICK